MNQILYSFNYKITLEEYKEFNSEIAVKSIDKSMKKAKILGIIQIVIAVFYLVSFFIDREQMSLIYSVLAVIVLFVGIFGVFLYPKVFAKKLNKVVTKVYNEIDYFKNDISLEFYEDYVFEQNSEYKIKKQYSEIVFVDQSDNILAFLFDKNKMGGAIIIPKISIDDNIKDDFYIFIKDKIK
ncbi:MAG: hypothetical protein ACRCZK_04785 [Oscillospiraceae bacterium]